MSTLLRITRRPAHPFAGHLGSGVLHEFRRAVSAIRASRSSNGPPSVAAQFAPAPPPAARWPRPGRPAPRPPSAWRGKVERRCPSALRQLEQCGRGAASSIDLLRCRRRVPPPPHSALQGLGEDGAAPRFRRGGRVDRPAHQADRRYRPRRRSTRAASRLTEATSVSSDSAYLGCCASTSRLCRTVGNRALWTMGASCSRQALVVRSTCSTVRSARVLQGPPIPLGQVALVGQPAVFRIVDLLAHRLQRLPVGAAFATRGRSKASIPPAARSLSRAMPRSRPHLPAEQVRHREGTRPRPGERCLARVIAGRSLSPCAVSPRPTVPKPTQAHRRATRRGSRDRGESADQLGRMPTVRRRVLAVGGAAGSAAVLDGAVLDEADRLTARIPEGGRDGHRRRAPTAARGLQHPPCR